MTSTHQLNHVADDELLRRLSHLVHHARRVDAVLVAHIGEVDARRLYLRDAPSMFVYCTQILHLSEYEAYARITVARAARRYPILLAMLADGRLHVSGIGKLAPHLTDANHAVVLARATHKSKREIEELIAELAPRPDVPAAIRTLPVAGATAAPHGPVCEHPSASGQLGPDRVAARGDDPAASLGAPLAQLGPDRVGPAQALAATPVALAPPLALCPTGIPAATVMPLSPARYQVQFTASAKLRDKLERLTALTREDLATLIETAVTERLERLEAKRFGVTKAPRKALHETNIAPSSRYIPAPVRRVVRQRDGERCTFVRRSGGRCTERRGLEFHHRHPYGRGGSHSPENLCLMCRQHNIYLAELEYGRERIDKYRRRPDHIHEEPPAYVVGSGSRRSVQRWIGRACDG